MRAVAIIPTRGGSKGLPNKNLRLLAGRPMLEFSIEAAKRATSISEVIVSTDDDDIEKCAQSAGARVFRHPSQLSTDEARTFPVIQWGLARLTETGRRPDLVAVLRATTPFRSSTDIDAAVALMRAAPEADSLVSVVELPGGHPKRLKQISNVWIVDPFDKEGSFPVRRQEVETVYIRNGGIYLALPEVIEDGGLWGRRCLAYVMPRERSLNINDDYDYRIASALI